MTRRGGCFLYGYYGAGNFGDDLLLAAVLRGLHGIAPQTRFFIRSHGQAMPLPPGMTAEIAETEQVWQQVGRSRIAKAAAYLAGYRPYLRRCDWLIFGGGTLFHARGTLLPLLLQLALCVMARLQGLRIAAIGVGIAELPSPAARLVMRAIIGCCGLFLVRDAAALRQAAGAARLTADLAFSDAALRPLPMQQAGDAIGLCVYPPACQPGSPALQTMALAMRAWLADGRSVVFVVFQPADHEVFGNLRRLLDLAEDAVPERLATLPALADGSLFAGIGMMLGMRFHGLVTAAQAGLPFAGLAHDNKISEFCARFAMPWLPAGGWDGAALAGMPAALQGRHPDPLVVQTCRAAANENFSMIAALMNTAHD